MTSYVCTGTSVWVITKEVLLISSSGCWALLLVAVCRSYCGRFLTVFHHVTDGNCQGATTAAGLRFISPQVQTVAVEVASIPSNVSFASTTSIVCGASIQQSAGVSHKP